MQLHVESTEIPDVKLIKQFGASDARGRFTKTYHQSQLTAQGIDFNMKESFYSVSHKNVIRGLHFHHPPFEHSKLVFCISGSIMDVALDMRKESPTFGKHVSKILTAENRLALYIPAGFAHGFKCLEDNTTTFYFISGEYEASADDGILYSSANIDWCVEEPILSERDLLFKPFNEFQSPF